jgi:hypothetical protein
MLKKFLRNSVLVIGGLAFIGYLLPETKCTIDKQTEQKLLHLIIKNNEINSVRCPMWYAEAELVNSCLNHPDVAIELARRERDIDKAAQPKEWRDHNTNSDEDKRWRCEKSIYWSLNGLQNWVNEGAAVINGG